ncbi:hypothetical protein HanRHA438_Chr12g0561641 [Helianthus annuus]|nr:hypothetical protein HanIR_Chr12g0593861 [Helianthus annuus]KAJ0867303.1 hypothetical protein HanRHA438_Chr12g0561641 [Helianthus annuus]
MLQHAYESSQIITILAKRVKAIKPRPPPPFTFTTFCSQHSHVTCFAGEAARSRRRRRPEFDGTHDILVVSLVVFSLVSLTRSPSPESSSLAGDS